MNHANGSDKFYCGNCGLTFSYVNENRKAVCPVCKHSRDDNFNQVGIKMIKCLSCHCVFTYSNEQKITCPNNCI
jgi:hypothetical protein